VKIVLEATDLRPLMETIVKETLRIIDESSRATGERIAFTEPEAAALLGIAPHVLRDRRLDGEVSASRCGRRILYKRSDLFRLLENNRITQR